jgi:CRISPR-associated protein Cas2
LGYGERVQFSVFQCFITLTEMRQLYEKVKKKVKPTEDNVRFYWISPESTTLTLTIGSNVPKPPPNSYII